MCLPHIRLLVMGLTTLSAAFAVLAQAAGPEAALDYRSPDFYRAEQDLGVQRAALGRTTLGLGASLELRPYLEYAEDLSEPIGVPTFGPGLEGAASLGYTYNYPGIYLARTEVLQAEKRFADTRRESVRAALTAYTDLLMAQLNLRREQAALAEDRRDLREARAERASGDATVTEEAMAQLGVDSGTRSVIYARRTLQDVTERVRRYGLDGPVRFAPLVFALPEVASEETLTYRVAQERLGYTQALNLQRSVYGVVDEIRLGTRYDGDDFDISGGIGLEQGLPTVDVYASYDDQDPEAWTVTLGATIRLDDDTLGDFAEAEREIKYAQADLAELAPDLTELLQDARAAALFDESSVASSAHDFDLIRQRIGELEVQVAAQPRLLAALERDVDRAQQRFDTLRSQRERETDPEVQQRLDEALTVQQERVNTHQTVLSEAQQEGAGAEAELEQYREFRDISEENLYRAWSEYIGAVDAYLALVDAGWTLK